MLSLLLMIVEIIGITKKMKIHYFSVKFDTKCIQNAFLD